MFLIFNLGEDEPLFVKAQVELERIEKEEELLSKLEAAIATGKANTNLGMNVIFFYVFKILRTVHFNSRYAKGMGS